MGEGKMSSYIDAADFFDTFPEIDKIPYSSWAVTHVVDVRPNVRGKWQGYNTEEPHKWVRDDGEPIFLVCSKCNGTVLNNGSAQWNFCPNCGADMRGDTE